MSTINSYYSLLNNNSTSLDSSSNSLASALSAASGTANSSTGSTDTSSLAYLLNLSPEAQNYLSSGLSSSANTATDIPDNSSDDATTSSASTGTATFVLSSGQQKKLEAIIQKHKGEPYNQTTFDAIQKDLEKAGIAPDQIAQQAKINAFNPTLSLLDALGGTNSNAQLIPSDADLATKTQNYVNDIAARFDKVAAPAEDTTAGGADTLSTSA